MSRGIEMDSKKSGVLEDILCVEECRDLAENTSTVSTNTVVPATRENNRKLLEELNKTRQLMLKNTGGCIGGRSMNASNYERNLQVLKEVEPLTTGTWIVTDSGHNPILPVFPRFDFSNSDESSKK